VNLYFNTKNKKIKTDFEKNLIENEFIYDEWLITRRQMICSSFKIMDIWKFDGNHDDFLVRSCIVASNTYNIFLTALLPILMFVIIWVLDGRNFRSRRATICCTTSWSNVAIALRKANLVVSFILRSKLQNMLITY
jgi:hypothetical protein